MSNKLPNLLTSFAYERKELVNYYMDSGFTEKEARAKVAKMSDKRVAEIIDSIPEEGEE